MKIIFKSVALFMVLSLTAVGCEKETISDPIAVASEDAAMYTVYYSIDGENSRVTILDEDSWKSFLEWMVALSREGHRVSFRRGIPTSNRISKETVIFTTSSHHEAEVWADIKIKEGYEVTIQFDSKTGIYTCTAIR